MSDLCPSCGGGLWPGREETACKDMFHPWNQEKEPDLDIAEDFKYKLDTQGVASYKVSDGTVWGFSTKMLESLLEKSRETGKVVVFVKTGQKN